ncbi:SGNH/GDSL hydrolase family protein [Phytomonospora endophytica]|uniref:Lysophospholipase L1-like esterase n=1 Tax=Phytomonospora endophytica TaxID=714109 RepID=A0A841FMH7_9ACTN|nr:GDSL-type esterase/lipase family protein [Phytomonospora endophytica]MBB6037336.1 lysophospholipase L1-like esterase [Phytomonospora endophytica]GIG69920.1 hypothetical protein Pen01_62150 [Phytomonospora endophytica]
MKLLCLGDSITRAQVSADYTAILRDRLPRFTVVGSGVNHEMSAGLLARLDTAVAARPDVVTVLIGTNDLRHALDPRDADALTKRWGLTGPHDADAYCAHLSGIATRLRDETGARVALISPPVLGEDPGSPAMALAAEYADITREVATEHEVAYLPLHERMLELLGDGGPRYRTGAVYAARAAIRHFVLRQGFDTVSRSRGLRLTTDTVHLNGVGARLVADLIAGFALAPAPFAPAGAPTINR